MPGFEIQPTQHERIPPSQKANRVVTRQPERNNDVAIALTVEQIISAATNHELLNPVLSEQAATAIQGMDKKTFDKFLTSLSAMERGYHDVNYRALPQQFYNAVVHRALQEVECILARGGAKQEVVVKSFLRRVDETIDPRDHDVRTPVDDQLEKRYKHLSQYQRDPTYKTLQALIHNSKGMPEAAKHFWRNLWINSFRLHPGTIVEPLARLNADPEMPDDVKQEAMNFFSRWYNDDNYEGFDEEVAEQIHLTDPDEFYTTARWLEFLNNFVNQADENTFIARGRVTRYLEYLACPKKDPAIYLLHQRIRSIVRSLHAHNHLDPEYTASILGPSSQDGTNTMAPVPEAGLPQKRFTLEQLTLSGRTKQNVSQEQRLRDAQDVFYFEYLQTPELQRIIKNDFGVDLSLLSLPTQFRFLQFLKRKTVLDIEPVKQFTKDFGTDGLQTFLLLEEGEEYGNALLALSERLDPAIAHSLFQTYREFVQRMEARTSSMMSMLHSLDYQTTKTAPEVARLLLSRANLLLIQASEQLAQATPHDHSQLIQEMVQKFHAEDEGINRLMGEFETVTSAVQQHRSEKQRVQYQRHVQVALESLLRHGQKILLPKTFYESVESGLASETVPTQIPLYYPVGITSNMPEALDVSKQMAKPIEAYGFILWLANHARQAGMTAELIVCDEIQASNYQQLYEVSEEDARQNARRIGEKDRQWYRTAIRALQCEDWVRVIDYREFLNRNRAAHERYEILTRRLSTHPALQPLFEAMVEDAVAKKSRGGINLTYGLEELNSILATHGTKVSHVKEARYDVVAAFIQNLELAWQRAMNTPIEDASLPELSPFIKRVAELLKEAMNDRARSSKDTTKKESDQTDSYKYYASIARALVPVADALKTIKDPKQLKLKKQDIQFNFVNPSVSSASFGWDPRGAARMGFIEPYSTWFIAPGDAPFLSSNQVVALAHGPIAGKILALPPEKQLEYVERSVKPLLQQFFQWLDVAEEYPNAIGKTKDQLSAELRSCTTLIDVIKFIQRYIVAPIRQSRSAPDSPLEPAFRVPPT